MAPIDFSAKYHWKQLHGVNLWRHKVHWYFSFVIKPRKTGYGHVCKVNAIEKTSKANQLWPYVNTAGFTHKYSFTMV